MIANVASEKATAGRRILVPVSWITMTSQDLFFPYEDSDFWGLSELPPFSLWVNGRWYDAQTGQNVELEPDDPRFRMRRDGHPWRVPGAYVFRGG